MTTVQFRGVKAPLIPLERLTPGEADAVERVTGMTWRKIQFRGRTCACEHSIDLHMHQSDGELDTSNSRCQADGCPCDEFDADLPSLIDAALTWVALKRVDPKISFGDVQGTEMADLEFDEADEPDPTEPPPEAA